ncbi:UDP-glucuronic acid/UDP-N-acetylgalactosamine transporter [Taenia solium]|eukprot:TsM_000287400 transcript=TsM_000287400 gene=TsM_000287400
MQRPFAWRLILPYTMTESSVLYKAFVVVGYTLSSIGIMFVNKIILTANSGDINFDPIGYSFIFINNISTAAKGLLTKSRLSKYNFSSTTLLFYNSMFMFPFMAFLAAYTGAIKPVIEFPLWADAFFVAGFIFSCLAAVTLQFLTFECTRLTSALTTSVIGVMKNTIVSYGGMFVGGDYIFTVVNFCGVTISTIGAITYGVSMYLSKQVKLGILTSTKA